MEALEKVDEKILKFFTKISHRFQRLTGRTNYFLAKCAIGVAVSSIMVEIASYWTPLLAHKTKSVDLVLDGFMLAALFWDKYNADQADEKCLSRSIAKPATLMFIGPWRRLFVAALCIFSIIPETYDLLHTHSVFLQTIKSGFMPAMSAYFYLMSVDPLPLVLAKRMNG